MYESVKFNKTEIKKIERYNNKFHQYNLNKINKINIQFLL
jgi:hypothetical protein